MTASSPTRELQFSNPLQVLEVLKLASRSPEQAEISHHLQETIDELIYAGLVEFYPMRRSTGFIGKSWVLELTPAGRKRLIESNKAAHQAASAPVVRSIQ